ncbi:hypothetical protein [Pantoea cypripedii]|uniref:hypothetical protein n=1 Tax=Pantoea cypripedii TaxID=55209 RepID=UPI00111C1C2A|nr:hypothetical protein [Pantoea cypripedii]MBP2197209.1 hypothetical protein [Pantoea cypripedii]
MKTIDINIFAIEIKKLAAEHQSGRPLSEVKTDVDGVIQSLRVIIGPDKEAQIENWSFLLESLDGYRNSRADPKWSTVISHAIKRIKNRRSSAKFSRGRFIKN